MIRLAWLFLLLSPSLAVAQDRPSAVLSPFTGLSIDTFAADDLSRYLNPEATAGEPVRLTAGLNFEFRIWRLHDQKIGIPAKSVSQVRAVEGLVPVLAPSRQSLWLTSQARYGVRSADVDCRADPQLGVCQPFAGRRDAWLYVLRHARTVEAAGGLRFEFLAIDSPTDPAVLYVAARAGVLAVAGSGDDASDSHFVGLGLLLTGGRYQGSHVEAGWGRSDVYAVRATRRMKVDGLFLLGRARLGLRPYVQVVVDADLGPGADSLQTHVGVSFLP